MSAYVIVNIESVEDPAGFDTYRQKAPATVAAFDGAYVVVGGNAAVLEGAGPPAPSSAYVFQAGNVPRRGGSPRTTRP